MGEIYGFNRLPVRPAVGHPSAILCKAIISLLRGEISMKLAAMMKLATDIHHVSMNC